MASVSKSKKSASAMWGGRFSSGPAQAVLDYTKSVHYDHRLWRQDIRGSLAHAAMLRKIGVLTAGELRAIEKGLASIARTIEAGRFVWSDAREDVHMNIEAFLTTLTPAGAKLHTGRSRNDQVATDMRLWVKDQIEADLAAVAGLQKSLVALARRAGDLVLPGYTHLQRAQPVYAAHHLLAYVEMLARDAGRLADARKRADELPLGSGAIAGSTLPLDRAFVAKKLGFARVTRNSMDAVSDRDFILEYTAAAAILAVHLSRLGEDLVLWSSAEFGFVRIGDAFTTGSSLMPQKKNPDIAEIVRGKSGRVIGNLVALLTLVKGLPMTYNRDLQEDKERLFDSADTIHASLRILALMLDDTKFVPARCAAAAADPLLLATDAADALVRLGVPFRHAHEVVGQAVALAEKRGLPIDRLTLADWKAIDPRCTPAVLRVFAIDRALAARKMTGAPGWTQVRAELARWEKQLRSLR
jgi:argininosuccinate lyase